MAEVETNTDKSPKGGVVRSSKEIKAGLLRKAWMTGAAAEIISQIQLRHERNVTMPEGHREALFNIVPGQDRAISLQNMRNFLSGVHARFSDADSQDADKSENRSFSTDLGAYKNTETYKIALEVLETEREWFKENVGRPERLLEMLQQMEEEEAGGNDAPPEPRKPFSLRLI